MSLIEQIILNDKNRVSFHRNYSTNDDFLIGGSSYKNQEIDPTTREKLAISDTIQRLNDIIKILRLFIIIIYCYNLLFNYLNIFIELLDLLTQLIFK